MENQKLRSGFQNAERQEDKQKAGFLCHCGTAGLFGYKNKAGELIWYCERHRLAQWWADALWPIHADPTAADPPPSTPPAEPFVHYCHCGNWGSFGYGVNLRAGQLGRWYCAEHRPNKPKDDSARPNQHPK